MEWSQEKTMLSERIREFTASDRFSSHILITVGTNLLIAFTGTITGVISARLLGPEGRGELAAIQTWPLLIAVFASLGMKSSVIYFSAKKSMHQGRILGTSLAFSLLASIPFMLFGFLLIPVFLSSQPIEIVRFSLIYLLYIPVSSLLGIPNASLRGRNDLTLWNRLRILPNLMWLGVLIASFVSQKREPGLIAISYLALLFVLIFPFMRVALVRIKSPLSVDPKMIQPLLKYGLPSVASNFPSILNLRLDQLIMVSLLPAKVLGLYVVAVAWGGGMVWPILNAIGSVLFPRIASQESPDMRNFTFAQGSRLGMSAAVPLVLSLMLITPIGLPLLFGIEFKEAITAAIILVIAGATRSLTGNLQEAFRGIGKPNIVFWAEFGALPVTFIALLILLPRWEILGAAFSSLLGYLTAFVLLIASAMRWTNNSFRDLLIPRRREFVLMVETAREILAGQRK